MRKERRKGDKKKDRDTETSQLGEEQRPTNRKPRDTEALRHKDKRQKQRQRQRNKKKEQFLKEMS